VSWIDAGLPQDLPDGQAKSLAVGRRMIAIVRNGAAFFAIAAAQSARMAMLASLALFMLSIFVCAGFLTWMRRAPRNVNQGKPP